jgi:glycerophosphoryl diester phosphodiesterase
MALAVAASTLCAGASFEPGARVLLDAHNCYPDDGRWADRIDRALSTGTPLAIEQDLVWFDGRSLVAHENPTGREPTMRDYFFERIRPLVEAALRESKRDTWPIVTLNLDFKSEETEHLAAVWKLLTEYRSWLTTATRVRGVDGVQPLQVGPVLVLTGESDAQQRAFHDAVPIGAPLLAFGAVHSGGRRTNYRRWSNNPWRVVEPEGQNHAGAWTGDAEARLRSLVRAAHDAGLWIRFYTLNGHDPADSSGGWSPAYNFGSEEAARERWRAAIRAGADFVAVDQYELFAATLRSMR